MTETDAEGAAKKPRSPYEDHFQEHFALWDKYEEAAKHFNDLTMRWRLQVMGGLVTLVTVGGFVVGDIATVASRYRAMAMLSSTLLFAWVGVAVLDLLYYTQLLHGAADALQTLEKKRPEIKLSSAVEKRATRGTSYGASIAFYLCGALPLAFICYYSLHTYFRIEWKERDPLARPVPVASASGAAPSSKVSLP
jgi:hypothetical protein